MAIGEFIGERDHANWLEAAETRRFIEILNELKQEHSADMGEGKTLVKDNANLTLSLTAGEVGYCQAINEIIEILKDFGKWGK